MAGNGTVANESGNAVHGKLLHFINGPASLLRHSSTALVKRYAHLSPSHMKGVVEKVSAFGKTTPPRLESQTEPRLTRDNTADPLAHPLHSKTISS